MTTTTWTTTADVPPGPWLMLVTDVQRLLQVVAAGGAEVTGPAGASGLPGLPVLDAQSIQFTVTAPQSVPLTITFRRAAGTGTATTNAPQTDGLVLTAVQRAARHWGALLVWESDAGTTARTVAATLLEKLYGAEDRAVSGVAAPGATAQLNQIVSRVLITAGGYSPQTQHATLLQLLDAVLVELAAERAGVAAAEALTPAPPVVPPADPGTDTPAVPDVPVVPDVPLPDPEPAQ